MARKNPETPKESELTDFMNEEAALKAEISRNAADPGLNEVLGMDAVINAKAPDDAEITTMEKHEIASD
jgi:hypothetical protein